MVKRGSQTIVFLVGFLVWLALTWSFEPVSVLAGLLVAMLASALFGEILTVTPERALDPRRYLWFLYYLPVFLWEMVKANLDVAYRVLHPALPIDPGLVKIRTELKSEVALTLLGNSLTLTPGNTTVEIKGGYLYVHCIDINRQAEKTAQRFEKIIARILE
ncbi:MAG: Na+/H+ antiporter subunit E [Candidatus Margulisiibacteriota bacterium]